PRYIDAPSARSDHPLVRNRSESYEMGSVLRRVASSLVILLAVSVTNLALGAEVVGSSAHEVDEIVVTAQKHEQTASTVGMWITAVTGEALQARGLDSVADLTRLVPGLTIQESSFNSTSLTLRGIGFFNSDLATPPAVTIYVDETPLTYPAMTKLAAFDLERV